MIVAGSINYSGAALLAGEAAYRIGAGLVSMAVPASLHAALAGHLPEATWILLPEEIGVVSKDAVDILMKNLNRSTAMLIGPGFGLEPTTLEFLTHLLQAVHSTSHGNIGFVRSISVTESKGQKLPPLVIDADGLKLLSKITNWYQILPALSILTPHPGEMAILTGLNIEEIQANRVEIAEHFSQKWGHIVVLKGAFTVIGSPDGLTSIIPVSTPALARAGTGDVLAGLITGLRAQGLGAYSASVTGAWIHAHAGLAAMYRIGNPASVLARDVLYSTIEVLNKLLRF